MSTSKLICKRRYSVPKNMHIYLLIILFFCFSFERAICKPSSTSSDLATKIEGRLDLGNHNVEQTTVILARDYPGEYSINQVVAIYDAMRTGWYYYSDPSYREAYKSANQTLQEGKIAGTLGVGDCEDFAILISSLVGSLGGSTRITFAYNEETGQGHAYSELYLGKKDNPMVEDLKGWIKEKYGVPSIPGLSLAGDEIWLNLDYNSSHLGGPFFDEGGTWVQRQKVWEVGNKTSPKIVPGIDNMDNLSRWKVLRDGIGSKAEMSLVPARQGKAINLSYDLKENGFVGISEEVDPKLLSDVRGLNLSYLLSAGQNTLEIRLEQDDGAVFKFSQTISGGRARWSALQTLFEDLQANEPSLFAHKVDPSRARRLEIRIVNDPRASDRAGTGFVVLDDIRGVMNVPKGSPWARAEEEQNEKIALDLASKSQMLLEGKTTNSLTKSVLLAVESLEHKETLQGNIAIHQGLALLPHYIARLDHDGPVHKVVFNPNATKLATASNDMACIWDVLTGKELLRLEHDDWVYNVVFSPDGTKLATASKDNTARLWDVQTGKELLRLDHDDWVYNIVFSPDGTKLATASKDDTARLWDVQTGKELLRLYHDDWVYNIVFSPDGTKLASDSEDNTIRLWDVQTGKELLRQQKDSWSNCIAFSPNGKTLAATSGDDMVRLWNAQTGKKMRKLVHDNLVNSVAFSPDGTKLATASLDNTARIWNVQTGKEVLRLEHDDSVYNAVFSPDGTKLATASKDKTVRLWDVQTGKQMQRIEHNGQVEDVAFSPDARLWPQAAMTTPLVSGLSRWAEKGIFLSMVIRFVVWPSALMVRLWPQVVLITPLGCGMSRPAKRCKDLSTIVFWRLWPLPRMALNWPQPAMTIPLGCGMFRLAKRCRG